MYWLDLLAVQGTLQSLLQHTGAGAGIELASGNTLYIIGGGTVNATGGNAANGGNGGNGTNADFSYDSWVKVGGGGNGGNTGGTTAPAERRAINSTLG